MEKLKLKTKMALDETRILMLGAQVLLGLEYRSVFESGFDRLPRASQEIKGISLALLLVVTALLLTPAPYHQIVDDGETTPAFNRFVTKILEPALLPFALGLGLDGYVVTARMMNGPAAIVCAMALCGLAVWFWYGLTLSARARKKHPQARIPMIELPNSPPPGKTSVDDKVELAFTETRVVLPGAQALLGFQFIAMLTDAFEKLPLLSRYVHLASLGCIAVTTILLMTPPAYHRIVEEGENSERVHRFISRMLIAAMAPLALGLSGDFYVVVQKITRSTMAGTILAGAALLSFYGLWFGYTLCCRRRTPRGILVAGQASHRSQKPATAPDAQ